MEREREKEKEGRGGAFWWNDGALPIPMPMLRNQKTRKETYHICSLIGRLQGRS